PDFLFFSFSATPTPAIYTLSLHDALPISRMLDLRRAPLDQDRARWRAPDDYSATQALARLAREAGIGALRYRSVRAPEQGSCTALLDPAGFAERRPVGALQTWWLSVRRPQVVWLREKQRLQYRPARHRSVPATATREKISP